MPMDKYRRIIMLVETLNIASYLYYNGHRSIYSDEEWDKLYLELRQLEDETKYVLKDSPINRIGRKERIG